MNIEKIAGLHCADENDKYHRDPTIFNAKDFFLELVGVDEFNSDCFQFGYGFLDRRGAWFDGEMTPIWLVNLLEELPKTLENSAYLTFEISPEDAECCGSIWVSGVDIEKSPKVKGDIVAFLNHFKTAVMKAIKGA